MSKLMSAEQGISVERWMAPEVDGPVASKRRDWRTVAELGEIERSAWEESYAAGLQAGTAAGAAQVQARTAELDARIERLDSVLSLMARPLEKLDEVVESQLAELAIVIARQLLRRELKSDPSQVIAIVRETVGLLPASARDVRVHLHPDDAAIVRERLAMPGNERAWSIAEDPMLTRGGCRVTTESAQIDARLESRFAAVIGTILGEERASSRAESP